MDDQHLFPKSGATFFEWLNATGSGFRHVPLNIPAFESHPVSS